MLDLCLTVGILLIVVAAIMTYACIASATEARKSAGNVRKKYPGQRSAYSQDTSQDVFLNLDAFSTPDLAPPPELLPESPTLARRAAPVAASPAAAAVRADDDPDDDEPEEATIPAPDDNHGNDMDIPPLKLASLIEVQNFEDMHGRTELIDERPHVLGDEARALGIRYFDYLLAHHVVPRGAAHLTNENNIITASNALKSSRQSATLSHGAVAQRIGERAVCLFEPLTTPVLHIEKAIELISDLFDGRTVFIVLANTENVDDRNLAHLAPICKSCRIPRSCLYIEQPDGSFFNYIEDVHDFVPARINPMTLPKDFFSQILDYAHNAYDEGDLDAVMRTVEPLLAPLHQRVQTRRDFPKVLLAQALNLMGMAYRDIARDDDAISCFGLAHAYLREIEDYEAIKSVLANLGITLALARPVTPERIRLAIRHLEEVTQLNPYDDEAWLYLANSYLEKYRISGEQSLLRRALRSYEKAYDLTPTDEIASCMDALQRQIGLHCGAHTYMRPNPDSRRSMHA